MYDNGCTAIIMDGSFIYTPVHNHIHHHHCYHDCWCGVRYCCTCPFNTTIWYDFRPVGETTVINDTDSHTHHTHT